MEFGLISIPREFPKLSSTPVSVFFIKSVFDISNVGAELRLILHLPLAKRGKFKSKSNFYFN